MMLRSLLFALIPCLPLVQALDAAPRKLDTTTLVVMGEGLAAGFSNFSLSEEVQTGNFPSLLAKQTGTILPQPVFQAPGLGNAPGFGNLPVGIPRTLQTTFRTQSPPTLFVFNLSVPGLTAGEALSRRPVPPLVQEFDPQQTLINMILGYPALILEANLPRWTQLEYALQMRPTLTLVELGFDEVLEAAVTADLRKLPDPDQFGANLENIVSELRAVYSEVVVCTVPDPGSTAYLATLDQAEAFLHVPTGTLAAFYGLPSDALLTVPGLVEVGQQLISQQIEPLPNRAFLPGDVAASVSAAVNQMNEQIRSLAGRHGAIVYDLQGIYRQAHHSGWVVSGHTVGGGYLGGFFLLNGYFPGLTGHALIANGLIDLLNREYGTHFPEVDVGAVFATDPTADFRIGERGDYSIEDLQRFAPRDAIARLRAFLAAGDGHPQRPRRSPSRPDPRGGRQ